MKYKEIKDLSQQEIQKKVDGKVAEIFQLRMKNTIGQLQNPVQIRYIRKDIARMKTALASKKA